MNKILLIISLTFVFCGCQQSDTIKGKKREKTLDSNEKIVNVEYIKKRCNIDIVSEIDDNMDALSDTLVYLFLFSFDESCNNNAEYCEYSNEVLFKLLYYHPDKVARNIIKEEINQEEILNILRYPVNDIINIEQVIKSVEDSEIDKALKDRFIKVLKNR